MNTKILKIEITALFVLSFLVLINYFFESSTMDSYISISSMGDSGLFKYYFTSFLNFISYYSGSWFVVYFSLFVFSYVLKISSRSDLVDLFLFIPLGVCSLSFSYVASSSLIGRGLFQFIQANFSVAYVFLIGLLSLGFFFSGLFRTFSFVGCIGIVKATVSEFFSGFRGSNFILDFKKSVEEKLSKEESISDKNLISSLVIDECLDFNTKKNKNDFDQDFLPEPVVSIQTDDCINYVKDDLNGLGSHEIPERVSDEKYYCLVNALSTKKSEQKFASPDDRYFQEIINKIHGKLAEFKIEGRVINVLKGPVVDTFEWELGVGEKIAKLTGVAEDLSLALLGAPIRMVYPMKGRGTVGIEVPRNPREIIFLDEIINSKEFDTTSHQLPLAMGKDAFGEPVVVDLAAMPHMLVAGATGAGKSVFINSILMSLLIKKSPTQMKLILIDPKQLELALYARLPHLIMPVVNDAKTASISLLWAVQEMERRYSIMTEFGVRNIEGFNHKLKRASSELIGNVRKFYEYETEDTYELPYIVIIVDEFADLILTQSGKDIEKNICRLAGKARAAGIHLIIATQRPSVDVITGLIKANFPTRVSFRVTSAVDSRTILNAMGAEKLLGKGDMLYKHGVDTSRVHSSYVEEEDIEAITEKLAEIAPQFNEHVMEFIANGGEENQEIFTGVQKEVEGDGKDEKYDDAVRVVIEHRSASASLLQRRLGVGYNRAANLIEEMESKGVVGPAQGSKPRKVLLGSDLIS